MDISISHVDVDESDGNNSQRYDLILKVQVKSPIDNNRIHFIAANPPDYITSYSGSGLPFANFQQAFENTSNHGLVVVDSNGTGEIRMRFPNSYYEDLGNRLVTPYVTLTYHINNVKKQIYANLSAGLPYRSLTHPKSRVSPVFYGHGWSLPVASQETILRNSAYPSKNEHYDNFWGLRPPN